MNRSRWIALGFVILFLVIAVGVPAWKEHMGQPIHRYADGLYAAFAVLCMGLVCAWRNDMPPAKSENEPESGHHSRWSTRSLGWLLLTLSIVIAAADLIR
jgi:peptidoglycan/LPS O-acetylase OafA/YrhL